MEPTEARAPKTAYNASFDTVLGLYRFTYYVLTSGKYNLSVNTTSGITLGGLPVTSMTVGLIFLLVGWLVVPFVEDFLLLVCWLVVIVTVLHAYCQICF